MLTVNLIINLLLKPLLYLGFGQWLFAQEKQRSASHQHLLITALLLGLPLLFWLSFSLPALTLQLAWLAEIDQHWLQPWQQQLHRTGWQTLAAIYLFGFLFCIFYLLLGLALLQRVSTTAIGSPPLQRKVDALAKLLTLKRKVGIRVSSQISTPQIWGWFKPVLLLPQHCLQLDDDRIQLILLHELGHAARHDWIFKQLTRLVSALFWFMPPVWWLAKKQSALAEQATDDWVLSFSDRPADYAELLLEASQQLRDHNLPAEAMTGHSTIFTRVAALLDENLDRQPRGHDSWLASGCFALLIAVLLAAVNFGAPPATISRQQIVSIAMAVSAPQPPAETPESKPENTAQTVQRPPATQPQQVSENLTVVAPRYNFSQHTINPRSEIVIGAQTLQGLMPIDLVTPSYPQSALRRGIQGRVILRFNVDRNGRATDINVLASPHQQLSQAARAALTASRFAAPRLNGHAIAITDIQEEYLFTIFDKKPPRKPPKDLSAVTPSRGKLSLR